MIWGFDVVRRQRRRSPVEGSEIAGYRQVVLMWFMEVNRPILMWPSFPGESPLAEIWNDMALEDFIARLGLPDRLLQRLES